MGQAGEDWFQEFIGRKHTGAFARFMVYTQALGSQMGLSLNSGLFNLSELQNLYLELGTYTRTHKRVLMKVESVSVNYPDFHVSLSSESRGSAPSHSLLYCSVVFFSSEPHLTLILP